MSTFEDEVTVLTVTRGRPSLLQRAIDSVDRQSHANLIHIILIDDCIDTYFALEKNERLPQHIHYFLRGRRIDERSGPVHLAELRNLMIRMTNTKWLCFLDDDNEYEADHISKLLECAHNHRVSAVHSWTQLFAFDNGPYLEESWPWCRDKEQGKIKYRKMTGKGAIKAGSNILREGVDNFPDRCVDTSAWLLDRSILSDNTMSSDFSFQEWVDNKAEDDKLMGYLLQKKEPVVCNENASLKYYLGGYSTNHEEKQTHSQVWQWES